MLLGVMALSALDNWFANFDSVMVLFWDFVGLLWDCVWIVSVLLWRCFRD